MLSGESVSETTFIPTRAPRRSRQGLGDGRPRPRRASCRRRVRTASMPSDVVTWPVTVSASTSRTERPRRVCRVEARFVAMVVLPTPPFGLKTTMIVPRGRSSPRSRRWPFWRIGPLPSSTVWLRMHIASTRQRIESGVSRAGQVLVLGAVASCPASRSNESARDDHQGRDRRLAVVEDGVVLERLVEVGLAVEDGDRDIGARARIASSWRRARATSTTSNPAPASSATTDSDSAAGSATTTAGRATLAPLDDRGSVVRLGIARGDVEAVLALAGDPARRSRAAPG